MAKAPGNSQGGVLRSWDADGAAAPFTVGGAREADFGASWFACGALPPLTSAMNDLNSASSSSASALVTVVPLTALASEVGFERSGYLPVTGRDLSWKLRL